MQHAAREHAQWSASATSRNWNCPGALALTQDLPDKVSEAADWGTCCHQIAEACLTTENGLAPHDFVGRMQKGKEHSFEVDEEMADTAAVYVDYVKERRQRIKNGWLKVEQKFSLAPLNPPFEAGGTADAVLYDADTRTLEVVDLKGGRGVVVEATGNPQLRTYALGADLANPDAKVDRIVVTIVQPRAPHKDGRIRSETIDVVDLVEWTADLGDAMREAEKACVAYGAVAQPNDERGLTLTEWSRDWLKAGDHCKFCKAAGFCPALKQKALDAAGVWFDDLDQPRLSNAPDALSPEALAETLNMLDMIGEWINAVRAYAHDQAESGVTIPGYQLVEKTGLRKWLPTVTGEQIVDLLKKVGKDPAAAFAPAKLATPAQIEKAIGPKNKAMLDGLFERPPAGTNLVAVNKTSRPAVKSGAEQHFDVLD